MARRILVLALIFFAVVGIASATADAPTANDSDGSIGNFDGDSDAAPVGGPVPAGVFTTTTDAPTPSPTGGAAALEVSAGAGLVAAIAAVFL